MYCGICHSDLHQIDNDFGASVFSMVPGHENVGRVTDVGDSVTHFAPGDYGLVGCIVDSCGGCPVYERDLQQFDFIVVVNANKLIRYMGSRYLLVLSLILAHIVIALLSRLTDLVYSRRSEHPSGKSYTGKSNLIYIKKKWRSR